MNDFRIMQEFCDNISSACSTLSADLNTASKKDYLEPEFVEDLAFSVRFLLTQARGLQGIWESTYGHI